MNISVIGGAGYVGLITGLCLGEIGHHVTNVDVDKERICQLQAGNCYVYEEGIETLLRRNIDEGRLKFSTDLSSAVKASEVVFIAVGTPLLEDGQADLSQIIKVAEGLNGSIDRYTVLVIKSTVPAGLVETLRSILERTMQEGMDFDIVVNPEFLREGKGLHDFFYPDRIVIGAQSEKAKAIMRDLYKPITRGEIYWPAAGPVESTVSPASGTVPLVETDPVSAQMVKYASNALLATQISFINEIAGICEKVGADINEVVRGMRHDPRMTHAYLNAGIGFGGPCLGKDIRSLINIAESEDFDPPLLKAVVHRNDRQVEDIVSKLEHRLGNDLQGKTVAAFGLAFKAGTNDVRNSLALNVIDRLQMEGAIVRAHDPSAIPQARTVRPHYTYCDDPYHAVDNADALLILTEWPVYAELDYRQVKARMAAPQILDGRNLLDPAAMMALGFTYMGVGRP